MALAGLSHETVHRKVCHISPVSIHSTRWIEAFHEMGFDMSLITDFRTWVAQKPRGVAVYVLPTLALNNFQRRLIPNCVSMMRIIRHVKPDLVHLHTQHHYAPVVALSRVPFILHSWGLEVLGLSRTNIFRRTLAKYAAARAVKIVVDAECMKKIWVSIGVSETKVEVIPFGVDPRLFSPSVNGSAIRQSLNLKESDVVVISVRPFFPHYDIKCLIKAIPIIVGKHKKVKFIIKGKGPLQASIKRLAKELNVDSHVRFTSPVKYQEVPQYLAAADIYVSTSFMDSTSVSLLEAMACGLPTVTTDIAGNREWVRNEFNGLLYPPKDHRALADRIVRLVESYDLRKQFGERNREIILKKATWDECVSKMEAVYESIPKIKANEPRYK